MIERVIVAGGGTGGHLFPGIAVVEELRRRVPRGGSEPALDVRFVGTTRGIEARVLPKLGETLDTLDVTPLQGRSLRERLLSLARLPAALGQAASIVRRHRPDLVLGVGGYAAGPMLLAASLLGVKTALLEQNAHVGLTNRLLAKRVGRAYLSFDETAPLFGDAARVVGNPVRRAFVEASRRALVDPRGFDARARRILVLGGSQGAKRLNEVVPEALLKLGLGREGASGRAIEIVHQTGAAMCDEVAARYAALGVEASVVPFIDDVAAAYASASFVICRAGASTLAELAAIGRPAILVPFPFAADDHQGKNAESFERAGAAICVREEALDPDVLARHARSLLESPDRRRAMASAMRERGRPDAAAAIVDDLLLWVDGEPLTSSATDEREALDDEDDRLELRAAQALGSGSRSEARPRGAREAHPLVDFREGRALKASRVARDVPRLVVEPFVSKRPIALAN